MRMINKYKVISFVVTFGEDGERKERILDEIPREELRRIGDKMNRRALRAAGYKEVAV
ncbi:MAG: hypothetical protein IJ706_08305 [Clostridia bacterium]|nr:hypothetical protein [Clostridia bacterium]